MSRGNGMRARAAILSSLGRTPSWEITCRKKLKRAAPIRVLFGDSFKLRSRSRAKKVAKVAT